MPHVPLSEGHLTGFTGTLWRAIEGQSRSSTLRLVDTFAEHDALEAMLEASKPPVPAECAHLDYRFWSPFRYGCYPKASRFRRAGRTPGVWYGSQQPLTAICETIWGALAFFAASPGTPLPQKPLEYTAVMAAIETPFAVDLTSAALAGAGNWTHPDEYADCLALADAARSAGCEMIRYASVRHPDRAMNAAVLNCRAFRIPTPLDEQKWHVHCDPLLVKISCESPAQRCMLARRATQFAFVT